MATPDGKYPYEKMISRHNHFDTCMGFVDVSIKFRYLFAYKTNEEQFVDVK